MTQLGLLNKCSWYKQIITFQTEKRMQLKIIFNFPKVIKFDSSKEIFIYLWLNSLKSPNNVATRTELSFYYKF